MSEPRVYKVLDAEEGDNVRSFPVPIFPPRTDAGK